MSAELTSLPKRRKGQKKPKRHPWDWYVEQDWVTHRLCDFVEMDPGVTYLDPFCGLGTIPRALSDRGLTAFGTDKFDRGDSRCFMGLHDFLGDQVHLLEAEPALSIIMNPPFSYQEGSLVRGLAEKCIRRALSIATHKVAALLPLKWQASAGRYSLFTDPATRPVAIYILCERPSMPPGDKIASMGKDAWAHGKVDYMWVVWDKRVLPAEDRHGNPFVPTYWIPSRSFEAQAELRQEAA